MRSPDWKETAELIGLFAILASLVFVVLQLRQEERLLSLEMRNNMVSNYVAVNEKIIENADIWVRGNAEEELNVAEYEIFSRLLINFNDHHFQTLQIFREIEPASEDQILSMFAGFLARNPGAYRVWIDRERELNADRTAVDPTETITTEWIDAVESKIAIIKSSWTE